MNTSSSTSNDYNLIVQNKNYYTSKPLKMKQIHNYREKPKHLILVIYICALKIYTKQPYLD